MDSIGDHFFPEIPESLSDLIRLALDMRWSWDHGSDVIWRRIDSELWDATRNAWLILYSTSRTRLNELAEDDEFLAQVRERLERQREMERAPGWYQQAHEAPPCHSVAYFSMEFGFSEALPIYSGGLGILAGDMIKGASDLRVPIVGVGLLYQEGYFRQELGGDGHQMAFYPHNEPSQLPVQPVRDEHGEWIRVALELPGRIVRLRPWYVRVGSASLYLLDANDPMNFPADRGITAQLYGGGSEARLQQEMVLGIGGWRLLRQLGLEPEVCHLNEGHAAFAVLERAAAFMTDHGTDFEVALTATRAGNVFTTHTPVPAGFDQFEPDLITRYLEAYGTALGLHRKALMALGRADPEDAGALFNMAYLALRGSATVNGVSQRHASVSQDVFRPWFPRHPPREIPVLAVTNGVHVPSWDSAGADALWTDQCGRSRWRGAQEAVSGDFASVSDQSLWDLRNEQRRILIDRIRRRLRQQMGTRGQRDAAETAAGLLDPDVLTMAFARRITAYKRPTLLLHDPERLKHILTHSERPVQLLVAGKAHPQDQAGQAMLHAWVRFFNRPDVFGHGAFLVDYDMLLAEELVQGVDLWLNTPRPPLEASGTSGMKVLVNGGLHCSVGDGWWAEAYQPDRGWLIAGDETAADRDRADAEALYQLLEEEIVPAFYERDDSGLPREWLNRTRVSMCELTPAFSANRMVREYVTRCYAPAAARFCERLADGAALARELTDWQQRVRAAWPYIAFGETAVETVDGEHRFWVPVDLNGLDPQAVEVALYAEPPKGDTAPEHIPMIHEGGGIYRATVDNHRPADHYTPRVTPSHPAACCPLEAPFIAWAD